MVKARARRRTYDSSGRRARAEATRARILDVAQSLFAERGYTETTMDAIAGAAGVALPTVYAAFGSKRGLLTKLLEARVSGEPKGRSVLQTQRARDVLSEADPRRAIAMFAEHMAEIQERVGVSFEVIKNAARTEPDVDELLTHAQQSRYRNLHALAERLAQRRALRDGLSTADAARTIWVLASAEVRQLLERYAGWDRARYAAWLGDVLANALLHPHDSAP